jgi:transcriptional regulator with XRE-family HTH domain
MPARRDPGTKVETNLARQRIRRGITQEDLSRATGISLTAYRRLERGRNPNPPLRYLVNCSIALGCRLEQLIEPEWREWLALDPDASAPPERLAFWKKAPRKRA